MHKHFSPNVHAWSYYCPNCHNLFTIWSNKRGMLYETNILDNKTFILLLYIFIYFTSYSKNLQGMRCKLIIHYPIQICFIQTNLFLFDMNKDIFKENILSINRFRCIIWCHFLHLMSRNYGHVIRKILIIKSKIVRIHTDPCLNRTSKSEVNW